MGKNHAAQKYLKERHINYDAKLEIGYKPHENKSFKGMTTCLIFPLKNVYGQIINFYGRRASAGNNTGCHYYETGRQGLYPCYPSAETKHLIITESIIDCLTLEKYLVLNTNYSLLALYGTNGLTTEHTEAIQSIKDLREVVLWLDGDEAGRLAALKHSKTLHNLRPEIKITKVESPEGEDINSLLDGHTPSVFINLLEERRVLFTTEGKAENQELKANSQSLTANQLNTNNPEYLVFLNDLVQISVMGGIGLHPLDKLKVTLKVELLDSLSPLHKIRHSLDLYHDDSLEKLMKKTVERLELGTREVKHSFVELIDELENYREKELSKKRKVKGTESPLSIERKKKAIAFLKQPDLLKRTNDLIGQTGMVGEEDNRLLMYLVFTSRKRSQPLHIISLGGSGTGKTYLQEKIAELIPEEDKLEVTALSENALYYFGQRELKNKLVLIEDLDGLSGTGNNGSLGAFYAIRELQSKKKITKTIPLKDNKGNMKTVTVQVEGPISLAGTTTKERLYEDNANRSILIYLDGSNTQKEAIMNYQRSVSAGQINKRKEEQVKDFFRDMQRVLEPVAVRNPYAPELIIPETVFKPLRTNAHYLNFIEVVTFYNQYQRERKIDSQSGSDYIETTLEDIESANRLLKEVLLAKSDELTKASRDFLERLKRHLSYQKKSSFKSKVVRLDFRMSPTTINRHLLALVKYGYVQVIGGNKAKGYEYEILQSSDYEDLKSDISNALDKALDKIKKKKSIPVAHQ